MQLGQANDVRLPCAVALRLKLFAEVILDGGRESRRFELGPFIPIPSFDACENGQFRFDAGPNADWKEPA